MSKQRRKPLFEVVPPSMIESKLEPMAAVSPVGKIRERRRSATKEATIQQTVYLPPPVHDQLRELAFSERIKMHALIMEGLDAVFQRRGMKSLAELTSKP